MNITDAKTNYMTIQSRKWVDSKRAKSQMRERATLKYLPVTIITYRDRLKATKNMASSQAYIGNEYSNTSIGFNKNAKSRNMNRTVTPSSNKFNINCKLILI